MSGSLQPSVEELRMLADLDRRMDSDEQPFVFVVGGEDERLSVQPAVMEELGLVFGQTVGRTLFTAILRSHLALAEARLVLQNTFGGA